MIDAYKQGHAIAEHGEAALQAGLEAMADKAGLGAVLEALAAVCDDKANHINSNWQDRATADVWSDASQLLTRAAAKERT